MDMDQDERVVWPRDSLFRYFELLEKLQYNLEERKQLQEFAGMPWMLGVKFIRAAYIYLGRQSMFTVVARQTDTSHSEDSEAARGLKGHVLWPLSSQLKTQAAP